MAHNCDCSGERIELDEEPGVYECQGCGELTDADGAVVFWADDVVIDEEELLADLDDDAEGTWDSYGRHRTRLRDSDY